MAENSEKRGTPKLAGGDFFKTGNCHTLFNSPDYEEGDSMSKICD